MTRTAETARTLAQTTLDAEIAIEHMETAIRNLRNAQKPRLAQLYLEAATDQYQRCQQLLTTLEDVADQAALAQRAQATLDRARHEHYLWELIMHAQRDMRITSLAEIKIGDLLWSAGWGQFCRVEALRPDLAASPVVVTLLHNAAEGIEPSTLTSDFDDLYWHDPSYWTVRWLVIHSEPLKARDAAPA